MKSTDIIKKGIFSKSIFFSLILFLGCSEDALDKNNDNATSTSNFGSNIEQIESAVNGAFHPLTTAFCWGRILHSGAFLRSDEYNVFEFASNTAMAGLKATPADRWAVEPWQQMYKSIGRCNTIIDGIDEDRFADTNIDNLLGQAYFLRAFNYWYLLHLYGNIPLILAEPDLDALQPEQVDPNSVRQAIINDLEKAAEMLPNRWSGENIGRPTKWSAIGLMGKTYLYNKEWDKARLAFEQVVSEGGFSLLPAESYGQNFGVINENNNESLFEIQFLAAESFVWGVDISGTGTQGNYHIDYALPTKSPDRGHVVNPWLKDLFETNNDTIRRNETLLYDYPRATSYGGASFQEDLNTINFDADGQPIPTDVQIAESAGVEPIFSKKYAGMDLGTRADIDALGTNVGNNWRVIRYSDVLLMLAESLNELNRTAEAEGLVNQVRQRANVELLTGLSAGEMTQAIINERAMELAGEGHRFLDLVRWELADDYLGTPSLHGGANHPKSLVGGSFQTNRDELIWIPLAELTANPNVKPNPGY